MKHMDCNQIKIFINLEIIEEEDKKKNYIYFFLNLKKVGCFFSCVCVHTNIIKIKKIR